MLGGFFLKNTNAQIIPFATVMLPFEDAILYHFNDTLPLARQI